MPTHEDHRARFYEDYHKVAEEYDKQFLKKHGGDLDTTLIFVSSCGVFDERALIRGTGWFVLSSHLRIYHPIRLPTPARFQRRNRRPSPYPYLQARQLHLWKQHSLSPTMDWASSHDSPSPSHPLCQSRHLTLFCIPGNAWQTMVEPL